VYTASMGGGSECKLSVMSRDCFGELIMDRRILKWILNISWFAVAQDSQFRAFMTTA
jgi:hypothetical protein